MVPTSPSKSIFPNNGSKAKEGASCFTRTNLLPSITHSSSPKSSVLTTKASPSILGEIWAWHEIWGPHMAFPAVLGPAPTLGAFSGFGAGLSLIITSGNMLYSHSSTAHQCAVSHCDLFEFSVPNWLNCMFHKNKSYSWHWVKLLHLSKETIKGYSVCLHSA